MKKQALFDSLQKSLYQTFVVKTLPPHSFLMRWIGWYAKGFFSSEFLIIFAFFVKSRFDLIDISRLFDLDTMLLQFFEERCGILKSDPHPHSP
jgi:hypothetical protein